MITAWLKKYEYLFACLVLLAVVGGAFGFGYHFRDLSAQRDKQAAISDQAKQDEYAALWQLGVAVANDKAAQDQAVADAQAHQKITIEYRTITRDVTTYVQSHPDNAACDLDDDGLRLWREANAGNATTSNATQH